MVLDLFLLASMAFATGFGAGWVLRWFADRRPVCQSDNQADFVAAQGVRECEEIVELEWIPVQLRLFNERELLKAHGDRP